MESSSWQIAIKIFQTVGYIREPIALYFILRDTHEEIGNWRGSDVVYRDNNVRRTNNFFFLLGCKLLDFAFKKHFKGQKNILGRL